MGIYDYTVKDRNGEDVSLRRYEGQVILINNSATLCGFTPQYDQLQDMYEIYGPRGFVILDFPCNQFNNQAPGSSDEIALFCESTYGITFPIFEKIEVNGPDESPLYTYLKAQKGFEGFDDNHELYDFVTAGAASVDPDYMNNSDIKWNFTKFLIDKKGNVVKRYEPTADLIDIEDEIELLLREE